MSEAADAGAGEISDVLEGVFAVDEADEVRLAVRHYEWTTPFEVVAVNHVEWIGATGGTWASRRVTVEGGHSSEFVVECADDDDLLYLEYPDGRSRGPLERFEPVSENSGTSTEDDTKELSEAPEVDLEEDAADDAPAGTGDDVQEDSDEDDEKITVDGADYDHAEEFELPDGITEDDVDELTSGGINMGELAEELDVHPNRARLIVYKLGFYKRVSEVKYRGGIR